MKTATLTPASYSSHILAKLEAHLEAHAWAEKVKANPRDHANYARLYALVRDARIHAEGTAEHES